MSTAAPTSPARVEALPRPQPIGIFPLPAGYLLISDGEGHAEAREALAAGRLPTAWPSGLDYYRLAIEGDGEAALEALRACSEDDLVQRINRLVLEPSAALFEQLIDETTAHPDPALGCHVEMLGFVLNLRTHPPDPARTDREFAAMAHAAHATLALEQRDSARAVEELEAAAQAAHEVSKPMAGQLMGQLANMQLDEGGKQRAAVTFQAAIDALDGSDLHEAQADLHVAAGAMFQEMSEAAPRLMQQAIDHYHQALALVSRESSPETFAIANSNLGLAYLTMPMNEASDQLRIGVAVQSMRDALTVFTPQSHPDRWSSTQLNLANALVYMPSKHQAENISEAVNLYETVLQQRDRDSDPAGRARVLANQGNALAHLGAFDDAKGRLHEARALFEELEEREAVQTVRGVLDGIAKQESLRRQAKEQEEAQDQKQDQKQAPEQGRDPGP